MYWYLSTYPPYKAAKTFTPYSEKRLALTIEANDYIDKLNSCDSIKLYVDGSVSETGQGFATQKSVNIEMPDLDVKVSRSI